MNVHYFFHCSIAETDAREILRDLMQGVEYIHTLQIVHRDIKPENILITTNRTPVLSDFGLAAMMTSPKIRGPVGSLEYMAPEVLFDEEYDTKVDMWSLGM